MRSDSIAALRHFVGMFGLGLLMVVLILAIPLAIDQIVSLRFFSTEYAPGFSEAKFANITTDTTPEDARSVLGEPLRIERRTKDSAEWWYTTSKEPVDGWGTWEARCLVVSNGAITEINRGRLMNH